LRSCSDGTWFVFRELLLPKLTDSLDSSEVRSSFACWLPQPRLAPWPFNQLTVHRDRSRFPAYRFPPQTSRLTPPDLAIELCLMTSRLECDLSPFGHLTVLQSLRPRVPPIRTQIWEAPRFTTLDLLANQALLLGLLALGFPAAFRPGLRARNRYSFACPLHQDHSLELAWSTLPDLSIELCWQTSRFRCDPSSFCLLTVWRRLRSNQPLIRVSGEAFLIRSAWSLTRSSLACWRSGLRLSISLRFRRDRSLHPRLPMWALPRSLGSCPPSACALRTQLLAPRLGFPYLSTSLRSRFPPPACQVAFPQVPD